jgi:hypothetical protein
MFLKYFVWDVSLDSNWTPGSRMLTDAVALKLHVSAEPGWGADIPYIHK